MSTPICQYNNTLDNKYDTYSANSPIKCYVNKNVNSPQIRKCMKCKSFHCTYDENNEVICDICLSKSNKCNLCIIS